MEVLDGGVGTRDLDVAVEDDAPRVELLAVVHDDRTGLLDHGEHHDGAQRPPRRQRHVRERLQDTSANKTCVKLQSVLAAFCHNPR